MSKYSFSENEALQALQDNFEKAKEYIEDEEKLGLLLQRVEDKLLELPTLGEIGSTIVTYVSLLRHYMLKVYTRVPMVSVIAIVASLLYLVNPFDIIPDFIPFAGALDDAAVILACYKMIESDVDEYRQWRDENGYDYINDYDEDDDLFEDEYEDEE